MPGTIKLTLYILALTVGLSGCTQKQSTEIRDDLKKHFDKYRVTGSFVLYDPQNDRYVLYNPEQYKQAFSPASTFKICNSLIGLETGVIQNENFVIPWDSVMRTFPKWNSDHDLKTAFKNSTVWYYRELARRVGGERMKYWLDKADYGNADTSGGIDMFWLSGGLRITPEQQIGFLKRLHENTLPFSQRSVDIVKRIMVAKDTLNYVVRAKTGWADEEKRIVGWYVGYIEKEGNIYYFVTCIQSDNPEHPGFAGARMDITYSILDELELIRK